MNDSLIGTATKRRETCLRYTEAGWEKKPISRQVLKTELDSGSQARYEKDGGSTSEDVMRNIRLVLFAMLFALPFAAVANTPRSE